MLCFSVSCQKEETDIQPNTLPIIWERSFTVASPGEFQFTGMEQDAAGFIYTTGWFSRTLDFNEKNSGDGDLSFYINTGQNSKRNSFVAKFTEEGKAVWLVTFVTNDDKQLYDMALDNLNNIYLVGNSGGGNISVTDINGTTNMQPAGVWKVSSNGEVLWSANAGGTSVAYHETSNSLLIVGNSQRRFRGRDHFIRKIDAINGNIDWSRTIELSDESSEENISNIATNEYGDIVIVGGYAGTLTLPDGIIADSSNTNILDNGSIYIAKWDINGDTKWIKSQIGGKVTERALVLDDQGHIYHAGKHFESIQLDPNNNNGTFGVAELAGRSFISALDENGNYLWGDSYYLGLPQRGVGDFIYRGGDIHLLLKADGVIESKLNGPLYSFPKSELSYGGTNARFSSFVKVDKNNGASVVSDAGNQSYRRAYEMDELLIDHSGNYIYAGEVGSNQPYLAKERSF